jgi:hypothetical protein
VSFSIGFSAPKVLDFDIETRPLGWYGGDFVHKEVTAIASAWIVDGEPVGLMVDLLTKRHKTPKAMLKRFRERYAEADLVTGHYIRGYDLPVLNGAMLEFDLGSLPAKNSHDTKLDRIKLQGISSSQENLGGMLEIEAPKVQMNMADWRAANRLTMAGLGLVRERVAGDVIQHVYLRESLLDRGFLGPPRVWDPGSTGPTAKYTP